VLSTSLTRCFVSCPRVLLGVIGPLNELNEGNETGN
jgi:hypothetical protein